MQTWTYFQLTPSIFFIKTLWIVFAFFVFYYFFCIETSGEVTGGPTTSQCYIASLYFTMTGLTSVGFGNIAGNTEAEQIFCVIMLIFGCMFMLSINTIKTAEWKRLLNRNTWILTFKSLVYAVFYKIKLQLTLKSLY